MRQLKTMTETKEKAQTKKKRKPRLVLAFLLIALLGSGLPILLSHGNDFFSMDFGFEDHPTVRKSFNADEKKGGKPRESRVAGLDCRPWGGPSNEAAAEMVYWEDIPQDAQHYSPFFDPDGPPQYFSFEMDFAGWNNVRMSMETLMGIALAMGRTLVLPPAQEVHLLASSDENQKNEFHFGHFFPIEHISDEHEGFAIVSMEEYLKLFLEGKFVDKETGEPIFPPKNQTNWDGAESDDKNELNEWLRDVSMRLKWKPNRCLAAFPKSTNKEDLQVLAENLENISKNGFPDEQDLVGKPCPVDGDSYTRMRETIAGRERLCLYSSKLQKAQRVHFPMMWDDKFGKSRMLIHFYEFLFFQDWREDLWIKRFMRDHMRYVDEIQCAAARVVDKIRNHVHERTGGKSREFSTLHIRRGDFQDQYEATDVTIKDIYKMVQQKIEENSTIYIATDEENDDFFDVLEKHYDVLYLENFKKELKGLNSNYMGMIDQLISSRGKVFMGCFYSTFSGYINRLRGYHADAEKIEGYEMGIVPSYYYAPDYLFLRMQTYFPIW